jgi:hypothetical protein
MRFLIFLFCPLFSLAQPVADQTFKLAGTSEHFYAFAEGDQVELFVEELTSKKIKSIEFSQYPDGQMLYRAYELDSNLNKTIAIPRTGIYLIRFEETGLSKKVCRFTLHRTPGNPEMTRFDTQVNWDLKTIPSFRLGKRSVQSGKKTEVISLGGQATVSI